MLAITVADLIFRARQFAIAVVGAGVVFAMALLLTGMVNGFYNEIDRTEASAQGDAWLLPAGTSGPFTSPSGMPAALVKAVAKSPGVDQARGLVISLQLVDRGPARGGLKRIMMIGAGDASVPPVVDGHALSSPTDAVIDRRLGLEIGEPFSVAKQTFTVVGIVDGMTMLGGTPDVWVPVKGAQQVLFGGEPLVTSIVTSGVPDVVPPGLVLMDRQQVRSDSLGVMKDAVTSVNNSRYLMWAVAVIIVAALMYVSALQRTRDFAVLKAMGASSSKLFAGLAIQAVIITLLAGLFALSTSWMFRPAYNVPVEVPRSAYLALPIVAVAVGVVSSLVALRRAVNVDPALAFGGA